MHKRSNSSALAMEVRLSCINPLISRDSMILWSTQCFGGIVSASGRQVTALYSALIHWGQVTHICVSKLTIIGWDNGLSPGQCQAIIWTDVDFSLLRDCGFHLWAISRWETKVSFCMMSLKIILLKLLTQPLGGQWVNSLAPVDAIYIQLI